MSEKRLLDRRRVLMFVPDVLKLTRQFHQQAVAAPG
jgi:hypothetical protein